MLNSFLPMRQMGVEMAELEFPERPPRGVRAQADSSLNPGNPFPGASEKDTPVAANLVGRCQIPVDTDCGVSFRDPRLPLRRRRSPEPGDDERLLNVRLDGMGIRIARFGGQRLIGELFGAHGIPPRVGAKAEHNPLG
jgi:hypothetical protein